MLDDDCQWVWDDTEAYRVLLSAARRYSHDDENAYSVVNGASTGIDPTQFSAITLKLERAGFGVCGGASGSRGRHFRVTPFGVARALALAPDNRIPLALL